MFPFSSHRQCRKHKHLNETQGTDECRHNVPLRLKVRVIPGPHLDIDPRGNTGVTMVKFLNDRRKLRCCQPCCRRVPAVRNDLNRTLFALRKLRIKIRLNMNNGQRISRIQFVLHLRSILQVSTNIESRRCADLSHQLLRIFAVGFVQNGDRCMVQIKCCGVTEQKNLNNQRHDQNKPGSRIDKVRENFLHEEIAEPL